MKSAMKLLVLIFTILFLTNFAHAESPRAQLNKMVEQLQASPNDDALREKIIKLAQTMKPAPAVPEEAERRMARGAAAMEGANSAADYQNAAKEFELATLAAPWDGNAYFNLGVAQDKAENYKAALRSLKLALLALPGDKEIKALIFKVEYRKEKESSPEAQAAKRKQQEQEERRTAEEMVRGLEGAIFVQNMDESKGSEEWKKIWIQEHFLRIRGGIVEEVDRREYDPRGSLCLCGSNSCDGPIGEESVCLRSSSFIGRIANNINFHYEISTDGRVIVRTATTPDKSINRFERR